MPFPENPVFCAIDRADLGDAEALARAVAPHVGGLKLGLEFYSAQGPAGIARMADLGLPLFLDLKLHDIPNTVAGAVRALEPLAPRFLTLHTQGGPAMARAAAEARDGAPGLRTLRLLGVTVLTSLDGADLIAMGVSDPVTTQVGRLAAMAHQAGLDGLVSSPLELPALRADYPRPFSLVIPGIRPAGGDAGDQKRVMTPRQAVLAGADVLVIGRPITGAADPAAAAAAIAEQVLAAQQEDGAHGGA